MKLVINGKAHHIPDAVVRNWEKKTTDSLGLLGMAEEHGISTIRYTGRCGIYAVPHCWMTDNGQLMITVPNTDGYGERLVPGRRYADGSISIL